MSVWISLHDSRCTEYECNLHLEGKAFFIGYCAYRVF